MISRNASFLMVDEQSPPSQPLLADTKLFAAKAHMSNQFFMIACRKAFHADFGLPNLDVTLELTGIPSLAPHDRDPHGCSLDCKLGTKGPVFTDQWLFRRQQRHGDGLPQSWKRFPTLWYPTLTTSCQPGGSQ